jgi:hypothetical protein
MEHERREKANKELAAKEPSKRDNGSSTTTAA